MLRTVGEELVVSSQDRVQSENRIIQPKNS